MANKNINYVFKDMYVCTKIDSKNRIRIYYSSMGWRKKDSIRKFMQDTGKLTWNELRNNHGWSCKKVNVIFEITK